MKEVESKDLIVGRKYADVPDNRCNNQAIFEFLGYQKNGVGVIMKYISGDNSGYISLIKEGEHRFLGTTNWYEIENL